MIATIIATVGAEPKGAVELLKFYLPFQAVGLAVVMVTLAVLFGTCALVGALFRATGGKPKPGAIVGGPAIAPMPAPESTDPRVVAAIAAAITVSLEQPYRIIDIHAAGHGVGMTSAWAIEGRFQHFSSHKLR